MSATVEKSLRVLEVLSSHDTPVRLADLSRELGMNKSTTYRMLETMSQMGYVQQDQPNGRYLITTRMWEIGVRAFQRLDIRAWAIPYLEKIRNETRETAVLAIGDGQDVVIIEKSDSSQAVQTFSPLGSRTPMHCSSLGKAFLMVDTEDKLSRLKQPLHAFTPNTITTLTALRSEIAKATASGVALAFDEFAEGVSGIAAPVVGVDRKVHAMIGITIPTIRAGGDSFERAKDIVRVHAQEFSRAAGHS